MDKISKTTFNTTVNSYFKNTNRLVKFMFRYFSKSTKKEDKYVSRIFSYVTLFFFFMGFLGNIIGNDIIVKYSTFIFSGLVVLIVILSFYAFLYNNIKINKICKELNISKKEYQNLYRLYFENKYL